MFVLAYNDNTHMNSPRTYALPRVKLTKFNVLVDDRNFCDQPISSGIKKYEELLKMKNLVVYWTLITTKNITQ